MVCVRKLVLLGVQLQWKYLIYLPMLCQQVMKVWLQSDLTNR